MTPSNISHHSESFFPPPNLISLQVLVKDQIISSKTKLAWIKSFRVSTPARSDSQTVNLVGGEERGKKTSPVPVLKHHPFLLVDSIYIYTVHGVTEKQQKKSFQRLVRSKWNFPLEITSLRNDITLHQHLQISTIETQANCLQKHTKPSHIIWNLSCTWFF